MASLFEVDPETNKVVYTQGEESLSDGADADQDVDEGSVLQFEALDETEVQENELDLADSDSSGNQLVVLSEDDLTALAVNAPAAGSLNSSTIDFFDRLVDGLPADYGYVAYRFSENDTYAGTIIYGDDFECNGSAIVFGEGAVQIDVSRVNSSSYSSYIQYDRYDATDSVVTVSGTGNVLYYTNAFDGYPILGSGARPFDVGPFVAIALVVAFASDVLSMLLNRRRKHD